MTAEDVSNLVANGASESRTLEFKSEMYAPNDAGKREFLKDVTALANTQGGTILVGVDESDGRATGLSKLKIEDFETHKGRLSQLLTMCVDPGLATVDFDLLQVDDESALVVITVPKGGSAPHRVELGNQSYFYLRTAHGNDSMDTADIRQSVLLSEQAGERMRRFRAERVALIADGQTPVPLVGDLKLITHVFPRDGYQPGTSADLGGFYKSPHMLGHYDWGLHKTFCFEGLLGTWTPNGETPRPLYVLLYRNGVVEIVRSLEVTSVEGQQPLLSGGFVEKHFIAAISGLRPTLNFLSIHEDLFVALSLTGLANVDVRIDGHSTFRGPRRDTLLLPEVQLQSIPTREFDLRVALSLPMDVFWQSVGRPASPLLTPSRWEV